MYTNLYFSQKQTRSSKTVYSKYKGF